MDRSSGSPLVYEIGSKQLICIGRPTSNQHESYTVGLPPLSNTASRPVTVVSARGVLSHNMRLAQLYIAPWPKDATYPIEDVGTGFGLPSSANDSAVGPGAANHRLWARRERVPGAVIQPAKSAPGTMYQVVIGITRIGSQEAYLRDFEITYQVGSDSHTLKGFAYFLLPAKEGSTRGGGGCPNDLSRAPGAGNIGRTGP